MTDQDFKDIATVSVYKNETLAGTLTRTESGALFEYDESYPQEDLCFYLPRHQKQHHVEGINLHPFFANLLPEGYRLNCLTRQLKTSSDDLLSLLMATGHDSIGDISILPQDKSPRHHSPTFDIRKPEEVSFETLFQESVTYHEPFLESSFPGVQNKISAGVISFPANSRRKAETYILKLNPSDYPRLVENEFFFMNLAQTCGIETAGVKVIHDQNGESGLLVKRFDRVYLPQEKRVLKIHQEDACQLLNKYPADKYRVSYRDIAEQLQTWCSTPQIEISKMIRWILYSYFIYNGDLHAKNISVLVDPKTTITNLTPAYDLLSTLPYGDKRLALHLEGRKDRLHRKHVLTFSQRFGIREKVIEQMVQEVCEGVWQGLNDLELIGFSEKQTKYLRESIKKRLEEF